MLHKLFAATALLLSIACISSSAQAQTVTFNTNVGDIVVELFPNDAPISVANFLGYVERGDYEGTLIHRSIPNFVVQGGGFLTNFAPIPLQGTIENEFGRSNLRGTMAYARQGGAENSATSQFFFNVGDNVGLDDVDGGFTVFGEVISGMDIVDSINGLQRGNFGALTAFTDVPIQAIQPDNTVLTDDLVILNEVTVVLRGDVNRDGMVDFSDVGSFISILSAAAFQDEADLNRDSMVDFEDIGPFIALLSSL